MPEKDSIPRAYYVLKRKKSLQALFVVCFILLVAYSEHLAAAFFLPKKSKSVFPKDNKANFCCP